MEPEVDDLRVRKPVGAVLSVRVPGEVAAAVDEYAAAHGLTLSEVVRVALDRLLAGEGPRRREASMEAPPPRP